MADKIETEINSIDAGIGRLLTKVQSLKAELQSGNYGTDQLAKLQAQVDKLNQTLSRKVARRESLVSKQDAQELNKLDRTIETLQKKITLGKGSLGLFKTDDPQYAKLIKQIKDAESALKSFESQKRAKQTPLRSGSTFTPYTEKEEKAIPPIAPMAKDDIERRLNGAIVGLSLTNAEVQTKIAAARKIALDVIEGRVNLGAIAGTPQRQPFPAGGHTDQAPQGQLPLEPNAAIGYAGKSVRAEQRSLVGLERKRVADEKRAKLAEAQLKKEQELAALHNRIATGPEFEQFRQQLRARRLDVSDVYSAQNRGSSITNVRAKRQEGGVSNQFSGFVNEKTGVSTPGISSQFRSFGSDILRDIGQFAKWSIAVAAVYTPLQKLSELITIMVDNESKLADATIAANLPFEKSGEIFDDVAVAANNAGESINGTIDAYAQATRAAGRYTVEQGKSEKAAQLLSDSLTLSKLSTLDQSTSIDTLSAALLQSDMELDRGIELLNKWVKVSQIANVGIDTLAVGVAVLGDAAETSGLDIDHLNALIAVLAEKSISGSKEAANTAKALVGAYQSDKAEQVLSRYGIALRKTNGEVRSFLSVYQDLARLRKEGVLSEAAVGEIATALGGGGSRRAKDAAALINSQDRLNDLAREGAKVTGESTLAQDSLDKKLQTVETASTRLANAWQELAQTLGDDGGLLDGLKLVLNTLTAITSATDDLFTLLGRSGPTLATFTTALLLIKAIPAGSKATLLAQLGNTAIGSSGKFTPQPGQGYGQGLASNLLQMNYKGAGALGGAGVALSGLSNISQGKNEQALANVIGGVMGGAIGATLGGPPGLAAGAIIGSSAAEAMTNSILNYAPEWQDFFATNFAPPRAPEDPTAPTDKEGLIAGAAEASGISDLSARFAAGFLNAIPDKLIDRFFKANAPNSERLTNLIPEELRGKEFNYTGEKFTALGFQQANAPKAYQESIAKQKELETIGEGKLLPAEEAKYKEDSLRLEKLATAEKEKQLKLLAEGKITPAEYGRKSQQLTGFPSVAIQSVESYGEQFIALSKEIDNTKEAEEAFLYIAANGTAEQIAALGQYSTDIRKINYLLKNQDQIDVKAKLELSFGDVLLDPKNPVGSLEKLLAGLEISGATNADRTFTDIKFQQLKQPSIVGDYNKPDTQKNITLNTQKGLDIQNEYYAYLKSLGATTAEIEKLQANIEPFAVAVQKSKETIFQSVTGLGQNFYDLAEKANQAAGALDEIQGFGFQQYKDVTKAEFLRLQDQANALGSKWEQEYPGFESKPEDFLALTKDGMTMAHADTKILALLLEKLNEKAQKQLDGQYNIPEGATFWVPLTAAYYRNKSSEEGSGLNNLDTSMLDGSANNLDGSANALTMAAQALMDSARQQYLKGEKQDYTSYLRDSAKKAYLAGEKQDYSGIPNATNPYGPHYDPAKDSVAGTPSTTQETGIAQLLSEIKNWLQSSTIFNSISGKTTTSGNIGGGISNRTTPTSAPVTPNTKLDLKISSNINLMVDGRILASTLQNYLASELLRTEQSQGTITKRFVI